MDNTQERKVILYLAESLDGFIAENDGSTSWLARLDSTEADHAYQAFYSTIDTVIMGRKTYQRAIQAGGSYPYSDKKGYVFSTTIHDTDDPTVVVAGNVAEFVRSLKKESGKNIWLVGGADLFTTLLQAGLVDELIINIAPVLLGDGLSLVSTNLKDVPLNLLDVKHVGQLVELKYGIIK